MPARGDAVEKAASIMTAFAERTGLASDRPPRRYLWTDAFAVCNLLGLADATGEERFTELALALVDQVHRVLGRHHPEDPRSGWISGLGEKEGAEHPTRGGLRIGKPLPERGPDEPHDSRREWDRDGQYFHYLTKWMHALDQVARATGESRFHRWARELAHAAHAGFVRGSGDGLGMAWKMSTDLSRPLVPTMGQHDPLDGWITCAELRWTAGRMEAAHPALDRAIGDFARMARALDPRTTDPLGLGGLLTDASRIDQLADQGAFGDDPPVAGLLAAARDGLARYAAGREWEGPASRRLAFRELGLSIGLAAVERMGQEERSGARAEVDEALAALASFVPIGRAILAAWLEPESRRADSWTGHLDINEVMLASRLAPEGFLVLMPPA